MPDDRVDKDDGRKFATGEHVVADADLMGGEALMHAGVHALVVSADEHESVFAGKLECQVMVENATERCQENDWAALLGHLEDGVRRLEHGLRFEDHAWAAAVGIVVGDLMAAFRPVADVVYVDRNNGRLDCTLDDRLIEGAAEHTRKEREDVDAHAHPILPHMAVN